MGREKQGRTGEVRREEKENGKREKREGVKMRGIRQLEDEVEKAEGKRW